MYTKTISSWPTHPYKGLTGFELFHCETYYQATTAIMLAKSACIIYVGMRQTLARTPL